LAQTPHFEKRGGDPPRTGVRVWGAVLGSKSGQKMAIFGIKIKNGDFQRFFGNFSKIGGPNSFFGWFFPDFFDFFSLKMSFFCHFSGKNAIFCVFSDKNDNFLQNYRKMSDFHKKIAFYVIKREKNSFFIES
jgi:hypothetical protein